MRKESTLSDGSAVYTGNIVGPSAADRDFFNNPNRPPLKNFPSRKTLTSTLALGAGVLFIGGCNTSSGSEQKPAGEVLGAAEGQNALETSSKLLNDFINKWNNKPADFDNAYGTQCVDLVQFWRKAQGGPTFVGDFAYQMFGENPDFYDSIPTSDGTKPQAGDILVWGNKFNNVGGHTGIATGKFDNSGKEVVFEENDPWNSLSHLQSYSLEDPNLTGWLRAKNSSEISNKPNLEAILDQYLNAEGLEDKDQGIRRGLRFWLEMFTTKEKPVDFSYGNTSETLQITTNLNDWAPQISNLTTLGSGTSWTHGAGSEKVEVPFEINYKIIEDTKQRKGAIQINDLRFEITGMYDNFSDADTSNGWQLDGQIELYYIFKTSSSTHSDTEWRDGSEVISFDKKNGTWEINKTDHPFYNTYNSDDPKTELPVLVSYSG